MEYWINMITFNISQWSTHPLWLHEMDEQSRMSSASLLSTISHNGQLTSCDYQTWNDSYHSSQWDLMMDNSPPVISWKMSRMDMESSASFSTIAHNNQLTSYDFQTRVKNEHEMMMWLLWYIHDGQLTIYDLKPRWRMDMKLSASYISLTAFHDGQLTSCDFLITMNNEHAIIGHHHPSQQDNPPSVISSNGWKMDRKLSVSYSSVASMIPQ